MAEYEQIIDALRKADASGNIEDARRLAQMARDARKTKRSGVAQVAKRAEDVARQAFQGIAFGAGDEIVAGGAAPFMSLIHGGSVSDNYNRALENQRGLIERFEEDAPLAALGSEIAGAVANPIGLFGQVARAGSLGGKAVRGAGAGAAGGAVYGFNDGEGGFENRADNALQSGMWGGLFGAAAPVVGGAAQQGMQRLRGRRASRRLVSEAPTSDQLRSQATEIYNRADDVQNLPRAGFANAAQDMADTAFRGGLDADLTPGAAKALDRVVDSATDPAPNVGFRELDILRKKAQVPAGNIGNRTESAIGSGLVQRLDEFVEQIDPNLSGEIKEARQMWSRLLKNDMIEDVLDRAQNQASGFENGIRIGFRQILNNRKLRKSFTDDEIAAIREVVQGTKTGNAMRKIGQMFGVGLDQQRNSLMALLGAGAGGAVGGLPGMLATPVIGTAAQKLAERGTRKSAEKAAALIRSGGVPPAPQIDKKTIDLIEELYGRSTAPVAAQ